jgi:hypothetical protein
MKDIMLIMLKADEVAKKNFSKRLINKEWKKYLMPIMKNM